MKQKPNFEYVVNSKDSNLNECRNISNLLFNLYK